LRVLTNCSQSDRGSPPFLTLPHESLTSVRLKLIVDSQVEQRMSNRLIVYFISRERKREKERERERKREKEREREV